MQPPHGKSFTLLHARGKHGSGLFFLDIFLLHELGPVGRMLAVPSSASAVLSGLFFGSANLVVSTARALSRSLLSVLELFAVVVLSGASGPGSVTSSSSPSITQRGGGTRTRDGGSEDAVRRSEESGLYMWHVHPYILFVPGSSIFPLRVAPLRYMLEDRRSLFERVLSTSAGREKNGEDQHQPTSGNKIETINKNSSTTQSRSILSSSAYSQQPGPAIAVWTELLLRKSVQTAFLQKDSGILFVRRPLTALIVSLEQGVPYERGNYSPAGHSYVWVCRRDAPTHV